MTGASWDLQRAIHARLIADVVVSGTLGGPQSFAYHGINDSFRSPGTLIVLDNWSARFGARLYHLQCRKTGDTHLPTERLVRLFITIDCSDFGQTSKVLGCLLVGRL